MTAHSILGFQTPSTTPRASETDPVLFFAIRGPATRPIRRSRAASRDATHARTLSKLTLCPPSISQELVELETSQRATQGTIDRASLRQQKQQSQARRTWSQLHRCDRTPGACRFVAYIVHGRLHLLSMFRSVFPGSRAKPRPSRSSSCDGQVSDGLGRQRGGDGQSADAASTTMLWAITEELVSARGHSTPAPRQPRPFPESPNFQTPPSVVRDDRAS